MPAPPRWNDLRTLSALAVPVVLGELGWMAMNVVDTVMVGRLGPVALGQVAIGTALFLGLALFGLGLMLGLDSLVAQAFGAGRLNECRAWLVTGLWLALLLAPLLTLASWATGSMLPYWHLNPQVAQGAPAFLNTLSLSILPLLLYGALRRYLQALGRVQTVMGALLAANLVNLAGNWVFIYGHWGFPALGTLGSALSTCLARVFLVGWLATGIWLTRHDYPGTIPWRVLDTRRLRRLVRLGLPAAGQVILEVGAFSAATVLAGRLSAVELAAHQIALSCASVTFMVPLGIASAAAVRIGHLVGASQFDRAREAGWMAVGLAVAFMGAMAVAFLVIPRAILQAYTSDPRVVAVGVPILALAALFQMFDGMQVVATGALRGLGDTHTAMLINLFGYWALGLPIGYALCFGAGRGLPGIWLGLSLALILIALGLLTVWTHQSSRLVAPLTDRSSAAIRAG